MDEGTFARFCQWAYAGSYSAAEHSLRSGKDNVVKEVTGPVIDRVGIFILSEDFSKLVDHFAVSGKSANLSPPRAKSRYPDANVLSDFFQPTDQKEALQESF